MKTLVLCLLVFGIASPSYAAFSVSVSPYEGGFVLDFGKTCFSPENTTKEVTVRITSDAGSQYRLLQALMEPLTSPEGNTLSQGDFTVYSVRGSNAIGTLLTDFETPVSLATIPLYVSNQQGSSDSFTLAYTLKGSCNARPGTYRGRLRFSLEPINAPIQRVDTFLDVLAQIENTSSSISVTAPGGSRVIAVKLTEKEVEAGEAVFSFRNAAAERNARIIQVFSSPPARSDGKELPLETVTVKAGGNPEVSITSERLTLFAALPDSDTDEVVSYSLNDRSVEAGLYRASLKYLLEGARPRDLGTFAFEIRVEEFFDMLIATEDGGGTIHFGGIKPNDPLRNFEVSVGINSNKGKRYQVSQKVISGLVSKEGNPIPDENFTVRTEPVGETSGTLKLTAKTALHKEEQVLFVSDKNGTPEKFKVIYELSVPQTVIAGDYSASVVYSLSEL